MAPSTYDFTGVYGPPGATRQGVLVDHVGAVAPENVRTLSRTQWVVTEDGKAWPVVCGDFIAFKDDEGYPTDGHCGAIADKDEGACEGHAAERASWIAMTEPEKAYWEREQERMYG